MPDVDGFEVLDALAAHPQWREIPVIVISIGIIFTYLVAFPIGVYSATHQYSISDSLLTFIGFNGTFFVQHALGLVEVDGLAHVGRDATVVLAVLAHAIHLNGQQHRDAVPVELLGQVHGL